MMRLSPERSRQVAELVGEYDRTIADANFCKSDIWESVREELRAAGLKGAEISLEVAKLKSAVAQYGLLSTNPKKALQADEKREGADEYLHAIQTAPPSHVHLREERRTKQNAASSDANRDPRPGAGEAAPSTAEARDAVNGDAPSFQEDGGDHVNAQSLRAQQSSNDGPARPLSGDASGSSQEPAQTSSPDASRVHMHEEPPPRHAGAVTILAIRVVSDPEILDGSPIVAGTRIQTSAIRQYAEDGWQPDAIIEEYPNLTRLDIAAALQFEALARAKEGEGRHAVPKPSRSEMPDIPAFLRRTA